MTLTRSSLYIIYRLLTVNLDHKTLLPIVVEQRLGLFFIYLHTRTDRLFIIVCAPFQSLPASADAQQHFLRHLNQRAQD